MTRKVRTKQPPLTRVMEARLNRRETMGGFLASGLVALSPGPMTAARAEDTASASSDSTFTFTEITHEITKDHAVSPGYSAQVVLRWGDPLYTDAPAWDPDNQTAEAQARQFGYNNDYVGYIPIEGSTRGILGVNHEYTNGELMFPGLAWDDRYEDMTKEQVDVEMAAIGHTIMEVRKTEAGWEQVKDSPYTRPVRLGFTAFAVTGPAAGHPRMRTKADPEGRTVIGTMGNCAGGRTPWDTILSGEENINYYFDGEPTRDYIVQPGDTLRSIAAMVAEETGSPVTWWHLAQLNELEDPTLLSVGQELEIPTAVGIEADNYERMGFGDAFYAWGRFYDRFHMEKEPNEGNRFAWIIEIDPFNPDAKPKKRTALGRFKHEGCTPVINPDGRVTLYSGDDQNFQHLYRFVTAGRYDPNNREANLDLLDDGTLSVARFDEDGTVTWLDMVQGQGPLTPANGFSSQADVVIECRRAAELLGATPMDRPEDVETNPVNGNTYVMLTNNKKRPHGVVNAANPRGENRHGHIVEMIPPKADPADGRSADHTVRTYRWEFLLLAGDPSDPEDGAQYHPGVSENGWLTCPDNCAFDPKGRLWIATDQGSAQGRSGIPDGIYACDLEGPGRALTRFFYRVPEGAEMCGPEMLPDGKTLFVAVQHPAEGSTFDDPDTRFPDFADGVPPRPSLIAITKDDGGDIGS